MAQKMIEDIENPPELEYRYVEEAPLIDWAATNKTFDECQKEKWAKLPTLIKNFYNEHPDVTNMTPETVKRFRFDNNNISVSHVFGNGSESVPNPVMTFKQGFYEYPEILQEIDRQDFEKPSPIQAQAWPVLMAGHDLIGISQTGTGKTLAFLLPALIHIDKQPIPSAQWGGPNVLVMAPTRELAIQIEKEVSKYHYKNMKCVCIYGAGDHRDQFQALEEGVQIVIATPGRLNDLVQAGIISMSSVTYLVLDEADRMLDMGFGPEIRRTLLEVRPDRQIVMTSTTWPEGVRHLAQSYMVNPIQVFVGNLDLAPVHSVTQRIEIIYEEQKSNRLTEFFKTMLPSDKVIVFVGNKSKAADLSSECVLAGIDAQSIHGYREQSNREQVLNDLQTGKVRVLITTDAAYRGMDIDSITHIINYDFPQDMEEYLYHMGRTGRAGNAGEAISFLTRSDRGAAEDLIPVLEEAHQVVPDDLRYMAMRGRGSRGWGGRGGGGRGGSGRGGGGRGRC